MATQATNSTLATAPQAQTGMARVKNYLMSPEVKQSFSDLMGANGIYYLNQVMTLVANSDELQKCEPRSILVSAMHAASLRLSVDSSQGQAWIIPYKGKATFQLGYRGIYELALRTNLYRFINVIDVYEGEQVIEDRMTGIHHLNGHRTGNKVIGRLLYFQLLSGFEKTFYMTTEEIADHAEHYSQAYFSARSKWNDPRERPKMERKTVLANGLRKWGRFNDADAEMVEAIESGQEWHLASDGTSGLPDENTVTVVPEEHKAPAEIISDLGFEVDDTPAPEPAPAPMPAPTMPEAPTPEAPMNGEAKRPYDAMTLNKRLSDKAARYPANTTCEEKDRNMIAVNINLMFAGQNNSDDIRHAVLKYLTGHTSTKDLTPQQVRALKSWINAQPDSGGEWLPDAMATKEAQSVWVAALEIAGQGKLL
jgi:recombination protein RecT